MWTKDVNNSFNFLFLPTTYYVNYIDKDKITQDDWEGVAFIEGSHFSSLLTKHKLAGWLADPENHFFLRSKTNREVDLSVK